MKHWRHRRWPFRWTYRQEPIRPRVEWTALEQDGIEWTPYPGAPLTRSLVESYMKAAFFVDNDDRRRAAACWRNMRRDSIPIAHLARRRILGAGFRMVDILLLSGERQGLPFF